MLVTSKNPEHTEHEKREKTQGNKLFVGENTETAPRVLWILTPISAVAASGMTELQTTMHLLVGECLPDL